MINIVTIPAIVNKCCITAAISVAIAGIKDAVILISGYKEMIECRQSM